MEKPKQQKTEQLESRGGMGIVALLLFLGILLLPSVSRSSQKSSVLAPDFTLTTLTGKRIHYYEDLKGKKPAYLVFWATW